MQNLWIFYTFWYNVWYNRSQIITANFFWKQNYRFIANRTPESFIHLRIFWNRIFFNPDSIKHNEKIKDEIKSAQQLSCNSRFQGTKIFLKRKGGDKNHTISILVTFGIWKDNSSKLQFALALQHSVWNSQKKSHLTLWAKWATFTYKLTKIH